MASYELGGRADKFGNRYESRWVVNQLIRIIKEEIDSVILEVIGEEEKGVDIVVINKDGSREYHQCKGRNASNETWEIADLNNKGILQNAKGHLDRCSTSKFVLVSPAPCLMLHSFHERALNSSENSQDFYEYQIKTSGKKIINAFEYYCKCMNLDTSNTEDIIKAQNYLRRTDAYLVPDDLNEKKNILDKIEMYFIGNQQIIHNLLANYAIEENLLGHKLKYDMIIKYLQDKGILLRNLAFDDRLIPRIDFLNQEFMDTVNFIDNRFIKRIEVDKIVTAIENGDSIVIHGKAGYGKSGCIYEVLNRIRNKNIGVLALKMDKIMPEYNAKNYGDKLDLRASPIHCINELYKDSKAVIIFDQLDAIRWTNTHSSSSIEVCKEMISQVKNINLSRKEKISIIFVCRTYDYENDKSIKSLFKDNIEKNIDKEDKWVDIKIDKLELLNVKEVVGDSYYNYTKRLKEILRVPNNLYIWSQLDNDKKSNDIKSSNDLIKRWLNQIVEEFEKKGYLKIEIDNILSQMVSVMEQKGRLEIHTRLLKQSPTAINYLKSEGLINESNDKVSFVHQSFFDYFLVEDMLDEVLAREDIIEIIGDKRKQTPMKRYQMEMLLQQIQEVDFDVFVNLGHQILDSDKVRYFMKYLYIEVLSQSNEITNSLENLLDKYLVDEKYKNSFIDTVFKNHKIFIKYLISNKTINKLLGGTIEDVKLAVSLLESVKHEIPDEVVEVINPYILKNTESDLILYRCTCDEVYLDSDDMFILRMKLLKSNLCLLDRYFDFNKLFENKPKRSLELLKEIITHSSKTSKKNRADIHKAIDDDLFYEIDKIADVDGTLICEMLLPLVPEGDSIYSKNLKEWSINYGINKNAQRACMYLLKRAMSDIIKNNADKFIDLLENYKSSNSLLINEILIESSVELPMEYADNILSWIRSNDGIHLLNRTGENTDELYYTKKIIGKFTPYCSEKEFIEFEKFIYNYHEKDAVETIKYRIDTNREKDENHFIVYCHYWGEIQYSLLPYMCNERLSKKSKYLIPVLNRRFKNVYLRHEKSYGHGGFVASTISPNAHRFSDKTWIDIITNKDMEKRFTRKRRGSKWIEVEGGFYESSVELFASTFKNIAKNNPERFGNLALKLPDNIEPSYVSSIISLIGENEINDLNEEKRVPISIEKSELIINKYEGYLENKEFAKALCHAIENRSKENWSISTLNIISKLAIEHPNPDENEIVVWNDKDKTMETFDMLWTNAINNVRGCAASTIGSILWNRKDLLYIFKPAVESLVRDKNKSVRLAAIDCLCPIYNIEKEMAQKLIIDILNSDYRIATYSRCRKLVCLMYSTYKEELNLIIEKMFLSQDKDVCNMGASYVANFNIKYNELGHLLYTEKLNKNQKNGIISVAIGLFEQEKYKDKCEEILNLFLDEDNDSGDLFNGLFYDKKIDIIEDKELVHKILKGKISRRVLNYFIEYLEECNNGVLEFSEVILDLCRAVIENHKKEGENSAYRLYGVEANISNLIMSLYEKSIGIDKLNEECLDILDLMFESGVGSLRRQLSSVINDY
ncbi:MAG: hypothetical protein E6356_11005 [Terrisporobacter othiniensis]|nr:hypothetical protein [Terrisporobacter othiniensis]MDU6995375.1 hypothetical protein [Terrisporobacter othiniensis]